MLALVFCGHAAAAPTGFLYSVGESGISEFAVNGDASLSTIGSYDDGGATTSGSLVMAKVAGAESLYQMAGSTLRQFSVNSSTGEVLTKSPAEVGSIPDVSYEEGPPVAVFNPAASGKAGQNALYVLDTHNEQAFLHVFDINATDGTLSEAGEVAVQGIKYGLSIAYSGNKIVVSGQTGEGIGFQYAEINAATGAPVFPQIPDVPCKPFSCFDSRIHMLDPDHMLGSNIIERPNTKDGAVETVGVGLEAGGSFIELGASPSRGAGLGEITANASSYFALTSIPDERFEAEQAGFEADEVGEWFIQQFSPAGTTDGTIELPGHYAFSDDIFALGSGLYVSTGSDGIGFRLDPGQTPAEVTVPAALGSTMTGFLTGESGSTETPAKTTTGSEKPATPTEPAKVVPGAGSLKAAVAKGALADLSLTCAGNSASQCEFTATLVVVEAKKGSRIVGVKASTAARSTRTVVIARGSATLHGGRNGVLQLRLNAAGRALLARFKTLHVELVLTQRSGTHTRSIRTEKLTLRAPKKRR